MALLLSAHQLSKSFSGKDLFQNISFGIEDYERAALLGPNGAGKSTLLKILMRKLDCDQGDVTYRKGVRLGYLEQTPSFKPDDTIASAILNNHDLEPDRLQKAYEWLAKLELSQFPEDTPIRNLSGGWQKRAALARELLQEPDLLLLDEPTNHLDVPSIKWLETFLNEAHFACLIVTHDRLFLQRVCNKILDLDPRFPNHLLVVADGYEKYLETKAQMIFDQNVRETKLANTLRREKEWLARGAKARQTKQKARIESAHDLAQDVERLKQLNKARGFDIDFDSNSKGPKKLIEAKDLGKQAYPSTAQNNQTEWLFRHLNLNISPKTRLALMGINGAGKSTLIKALLGQIQPDEGSIRQADAIKVAYFEQGRDTLLPQKSVLLNICPAGDYVDFRGQHIHARSYLDRFGFFKNQADLPVSRLSGGEQARLRIAQLMLQECNILILDEPTNDLDVETLNTLEDTLKDFNGAVILVTHDRYFMDQVANQILSFNPFQTQNPEEREQLLMFADYNQWEAWYEQSLIENKTQLKKMESSQDGSKGKKKLSFKEKFEYENMEELILKTESALTALQKELEAPEVSANSSRLQELTEILNHKQHDLEKLYTRWTELEAKIKG